MSVATPRAVLCRGAAGAWVASTLGATAEDRLSGDPARLPMVKWSMEDFQVRCHTQQCRPAHAPLASDARHPRMRVMNRGGGTNARQLWAVFVLALQELVAEKLKGYEREHKELHMLLFPEVLERLARFDRVLSRPGGSLLLAGPSGTGRRSCALLMAYMHHLELFTPKMTKCAPL